MAIEPFLLDGLIQEMLFAWSYVILHKLCHYPIIALCVLLLFEYCHCNIFCGLIILYYNDILVLLYFWSMWCTQPPLHHIHITFVTLIILLGYIGAPKPPIFAPTHRLHLWLYNRIEYVGALKPHFCTTYKLNLLVT